MKYALIGCGRIAVNHIRAAINNHLQIVAVCDIKPEAMEMLLEKFGLETDSSIKRYTDYQTMLTENEVELAAIATESGLHAQIALHCMDHNVPVIIEKPIAMSISDAEKIIRKSEEKKVKVCACHQNRFNIAVQETRRALEAGRFGRLSHGSVHVRWNRNQNYYVQAPWRGTWAQDGGCLMNQCIHGIDLLRWMMGDEVEEVYGVTRRQFHDYLECEDVGMAVVKFKNGAIGTIEGTTNVYPQNLEETLYLFGETGTVKLGGRSANNIDVWDFADMDDSDEKNIVQKIVSLNGLYSFILHTNFGVVACVDQVRSMPLFYRGFELFDALGEDEISNWNIDENALAVYRNCVFTPNKKTLFEGTYQVQTGYYLLLDASGTHQYPHFTIEYAEQQITDMDEAVQVLDASLTQTAQRTIEILNGRTAAIPLSGGHDSRILTFYLRRLGYQNIITYSYGLPGNPESVRSEKVAKILGLPWHFVYTDPKEMRKLYQSEFRRFALFAGNGTSLPHLQEWFAVDQLRKKGVFPEECVFIPGYAGDFTAGKYIWRDASGLEPISRESLIQFILRYEFSPDYFLGREICC